MIFSQISDWMFLFFRKWTKVLSGSRFFFFLQILWEKSAFWIVNMRGSTGELAKHLHPWLGVGSDVYIFCTSCERLELPSTATPTPTTLLGGGSKCFSTCVPDLINTFRAALPAVLNSTSILSSVNQQKALFLSRPKIGGSLVMVHDTLLPENGYIPYTQTSWPASALFFLFLLLQYVRERRLLKKSVPCENKMPIVGRAFYWLNVVQYLKFAGATSAVRV